MSLRDLQNVDVHLSGLARLAEQRQQREDPEREWRECGGWSVPRDSSWPAVMEGGGERKCSVCNVRVPMANCGAGWCWPCYWHCAGKPAAALHTSKCAVYHCAPAGPAQLACPPCTGAAAVGTQQGGRRPRRQRARATCWFDGACYKCRREAVSPSPISVLIHFAHDRKQYSANTRAYSYE